MKISDKIVRHILQKLCLSYVVKCIKRIQIRPILLMYNIFLLFSFYISNAKFVQHSHHVSISLDNSDEINIRSKVSWSSLMLILFITSGICLCRIKLWGLLYTKKNFMNDLFLIINIMPTRQRGKIVYA